MAKVNHYMGTERTLCGIDPKAKNINIHHEVDYVTCKVCKAMALGLNPFQHDTLVELKERVDQTPFEESQEIKRQSKEEYLRDRITEIMNRFYAQETVMRVITANILEWGEEGDVISDFLAAQEYTECARGRMNMVMQEIETTIRRRGGERDE
jgi:hypothetical protein